MATPRFFRIHPSIGIARVGNAPDEFFVGPERPNEPPNYDFTQKQYRPFKDSQGRIKRQAARFHVFEYELKGGALVPVREVTAGAGGVVSITWKVHLANRKAAFFTFDGQDGAADGVWKGKQKEGKPRTNLRNAHVQGTAERERLLVIDPGPKAISGRNQPAVPFTQGKGHIPIKSLGELRTDASGNLLVLGGLGQAERIAGGAIIDDYVNNDYWFDDMSDGPVTAEVTYGDAGQNQTARLEGADGAWVLMGPPDYAPSVGNVVRLFDTLWDVAVRSPEIPLLTTDGLFAQGLFARLAQQRKDWDAPTKSFKTYKPSFRQEIMPVLERALNHRHVHNPEASKSFHGTFAGMEVDLGSVSSAKGKRLRKQIFGYMRDPSANNNEPLLMPKGFGDNYSDDVGPRPDFYMTLTRVQYALLKRWADGFFEEDWDATAAHAIETALSAQGLDRAALENAVGGPFFPGIDCSWMVRRPELYAAPFRFKHALTVFPQTAKLALGPGFFSQQMALPWQADFYQCKKTFSSPEGGGEGMYHMWWAAHRPDDVHAQKADLKMVSWTRALEVTAKADEGKPEYTGHEVEDTTPFELAMYNQVHQNWGSLNFVINEGDNHFETQAKGSGEPLMAMALRGATRIMLKSFKGDYLHRSAEGVTTWSTGVGNEWGLGWLSASKLELKSYKGDCLHRAQTGITVWQAGNNSDWALEFEGDKVLLKSSYGDYLTRSDTGLVPSSKVPGSYWQFEVLAY